ncbi:hypothetical protein BD769DRAFT_1451515 [Suillus cothurnatus]|nr:hypothetical protein BD769DRAFT_1451515 [Suillus cothurnatus]
MVRPEKHARMTHLAWVVICMLHSGAAIYFRGSSVDALRLCTHKINLDIPHQLVLQPPHFCMFTRPEVPCWTLVLG